MRATITRESPNGLTKTVWHFYFGDYHTRVNGTVQVFRRPSRRHKWRESYGERPEGGPPPDVIEEARQSFHRQIDEMMR